jgi:hypothetical protein
MDEDENRVPRRTFLVVVEKYWQVFSGLVYHRGWPSLGRREDELLTALLPLPGNFRHLPCDRRPAIANMPITSGLIRPFTIHDRKGHQEEPSRIRPVDDQMCDPMRQCAGLAGARAGNHEKRPARLGTRPCDTVFHGPSLFAIQHRDWQGHVSRSPAKQIRVLFAVDLLQAAAVGVDA